MTIPSQAVSWLAVDSQALPVRGVIHGSSISMRVEVLHGKCSRFACPRLIQVLECQGISCEAVRQLLGSLTIAQALHTTLRAHQKPTASGDLPGASELAKQLQRAGNLTFVRTCRTRIVHLASGRDAGRAEVPAEVRLSISIQLCPGFWALTVTISPFCLLPFCNKIIWRLDHW